MSSVTLSQIRRGLRKSPKYIAQRAISEARAQTERLFAIRRGQRFDLAELLEATGDTSINELWTRLLARPYVTQTETLSPYDYDQICPGDRERILSAADRAMQHEVDLLGSGPTTLGTEIDWLKDYKTGFRWNAGFFKDIDYVNLDQPSDVKFPWELSRVQWLIPAGQAFLLTGDERFAHGAREILESWITQNPYAGTVNWSCTMEPAIRILSWTWLFRAFGRSRAWSDESFRERFLCALYLHGDFVRRNLERADINGNHYTADAAGLVFAGLFFDKGTGPQEWLKTGWKILEEEFPRQVYPDGVDFEGSVPYHRLVMELFLLPALYRQAIGLRVTESYIRRLGSMADFVAAYTRPDGTSPVWGDNDNARALPFGGQRLTDHRYLLGFVAAGFKTAHRPQNGFGQGAAELFWMFGSQTTYDLTCEVSDTTVASTAFPDGGFYIMRNDRDHVFIDCGPVGLAGRGGHGHNDILSFEAVLDGELLIVDSGCYVYTASYAERNNFRSTAYHNTPMIDGEEVNRFISSTDLWQLHYDARPSVLEWTTAPDRDIFRGSHTGFQRLHRPVKPVRTIKLDKGTHTLTVVDEFAGHPKLIEVPLHLAPGIEVEVGRAGRVILKKQERTFFLSWSDTAAWELSIEHARISRTYGAVAEAKKLMWRTSEPKPTRLFVLLGPEVGGTS